MPLFLNIICFAQFLSFFPLENGNETFSVSFAVIESYRSGIERLSLEKVVIL